MQATYLVHRAKAKPQVPVAVYFGDDKRSQDFSEDALHTLHPKTTTIPSDPPGFAPPKPTSVRNDEILCQIQELHRAIHSD